MILLKKGTVKTVPVNKIIDIYFIKSTNVGCMIREVAIKDD